MLLASKVSGKSWKAEIFRQAEIIHEPSYKPSTDLAGLDSLTSFSSWLTG